MKLLEGKVAIVTGAARGINGGVVCRILKYRILDDDRRSRSGHPEGNQSIECVKSKAAWHR